MKEEVRAQVREIDGQLVLDDPDALAVLKVVAKLNCAALFDDSKERVAHFARRVVERGLKSEDVVITILNVDDVHGGPIADILMPNHPWEEYRARGELPVARGLAGRQGIQAILEDFDKEAAAKLRAYKGVAVVVVDHCVAEVYPT